MKHVLLFGAGKSATILIDYLIGNAKPEEWKVIVVDADLHLANSKIGNSPYANAVSFDINDIATTNKYVAAADIVISLLPPTLHMVVAKSCVREKKNLLTASYVDDAMKSLTKEVEKNELLFLCEMGLDPGIDHMSAMRIIDQIRAKGGNIISFRSHCGGLVAPESDDNPWHYKISWNPRNILMAGKSGAHFREDGEEKRLAYTDLFTTDRLVEIGDIGFMGWYPNRDSLSYAPLYGLENASTFIRTTLRHPDFMYGWKNVIELKLTDETPEYNTDGITLMDFFQEHMQKHGFGNWLQQKLSDRLSQTKTLLENLMKLVEAENDADKEGEEVPDKFMMVDRKGTLEDLNLEEIKTNAAATVAHKMHEANLTMKQLYFLGMDDRTTLINKGLCSAADVMQVAMEKKLALQSTDKDMVVMYHELEYEKGTKKFEVTSSLVVLGEDGIHTAMAKTVGLPLGIAAKLILNGTIKQTGICIPTFAGIYEPVLKELEEYGIKFDEKKVSK